MRARGYNVVGIDDPNYLEPAPPPAVVATAPPMPAPVIAPVVAAPVVVRHRQPEPEPVAGDHTAPTVTRAGGASPPDARPPIPELKIPLPGD
jgi:hypothetical protein